MRMESPTSSEEPWYSSAWLGSAGHAAFPNPPSTKLARRKNSVVSYDSAVRNGANRQTSHAKSQKISQNRVPFSDFKTFKTTIHEQTALHCITVAQPFCALNILDRLEFLASNACVHCSLLKSCLLLSVIQWALSCLLKSLGMSERYSVYLTSVRLLLHTVECWSIKRTGTKDLWLEYFNYQRKFGWETSELRSFKNA